MIRLIQQIKTVRHFDKNLSLYYGIGLTQCHKINSLFGLGFSGFMSMLDKSFIVKIEIFLRDYYLLDDYLKIIEIATIKFLQYIKCYRGLRHK